VLRLPLVHEGVPEDSGTNTQVARWRFDHRVVVVEDNDDARETLRIMLALWGCDVITARDGGEGLEKLLTAKAQIGIVDIGLPTLDGYDVARRVRSSAAGKDIKLVALTGYGQPEDVRRALNAGFDVHLTKPVRDRDLAMCLIKVAPKSGVRVGA
jgi:CheY-like chemotaxis protein